MPIELTDSGISAVGEVPWGTHFCHFYETPQDLLDILIPFFAAGLDNNEFCMWIVFDPLDETQARAALRQAVPGVDSRLAAGDMEILAHTDWYLKDGVFDLRRVIRDWKKKLAGALASGYSGMRVNGNEAWVSEKDWEHFARYEEEMDETIAGQRMLVLCTYPLPVSSGSQIFDVARTHQFAIAKRHGSWEVVESPQLRQAKQELKALSEKLEDRVVERTLELEDANDNLRALAASLHSAREEERSRIAREIHDELGSALTSLRWDLEGVEKTLSDSPQPLEQGRLKNKIAVMTKLADDTIDSIRRIASELRPSVLDDLGLVEAVEWQAQQFHARTGIECYCKCPENGVDLTPEQCTAVFRIAQEALTNIVRHAHATRVDIAMEERDGEFLLAIRDDGGGISAEERPGRRSLGLLGMKERAHLAGGTLEFVPAEGGGTLVVVRIPLSSVRGSIPSHEENSDR